MPSIADAEFAKLNIPLLRHFPELARAFGRDPGELLDLAGIKSATFRDDAVDLTYPQAIRLLDVAARELKCHDFGMRLAQRQRGGAIFGPLGRTMRNSRTFGDALRFASEHMSAHSRAARVWLRAGPEGSVFAGHELFLESSGERIQAIEQILLIGHLEAMEMTGGYARARCVHFRHEANSSPAEYRRYFGCDVRFGEPANGVTFSAHDLASPILSQNEDVHRELTTYIETHFPKKRLPFNAEVSGLIMRRLTQGNCASGDVAQALNIHHRTLRRRLKHEGTTFQDVKDGVRRDLTIYYLRQTQLDFRGISEKLGFAEQAVFSRSCRRWFGQSPSQLRVGGTATIKHALARSMVST
ncbi:AraC family transcriptional regulator [Novosphingobium sp. P6W]|uniref:AraC family transcriptional regulator n=1 Tax=Novosphingobium sp. P6W TaxID=1609758 RepID=UPI0005C4B2EC|nr:AraC family transcriptional regulator [Novosphingobium sp. P6W]AXB79644.1 AraC family transcriptional regulator [Novosphingobium sp. P6W]